MAFTLTYTDGKEADYDDDTAWEVDDGVLKLGRTEGDWTVLVSPSHWAVIEVAGADKPADTSANSSDDDDEPDADAPSGAGADEAEAKDAEDAEDAKDD